MNSSSHTLSLPMYFKCTQVSSVFLQLAQSNTHTQFPNVTLSTSAAAYVPAWQRHTHVPDYSTMYIRKHVPLKYSRNSAPGKNFVLKYELPHKNFQEKRPNSPTAELVVAQDPVTLYASIQCDSHNVTSLENTKSS